MIDRKKLLFELQKETQLDRLEFPMTLARGGKDYTSAKFKELLNRHHKALWMRGPGKRAD